MSSERSTKNSQALAELVDDALTEEDLSANSLHSIFKAMARAQSRASREDAATYELTAFPGYIVGAVIELTTDPFDIEDGSTVGEFNELMTDGLPLGT